MHDLSNILIELIFIVLHFFVFLANYAIAKKKLFYPAALFSLLWTVILFLHFIFGFTILNELFPLRLETYLIIFIGTICFSIGAFLVTGYFEQNHSKKMFNSEVSFQKTNISLLLRLIIVGIIVIGVPFYIQASYRVFLASNIDNFFVGLRTELSYGDEDIGITKYLISFSFIVFAINYYTLLEERTMINRVLLWISFIFAIVYSIFATGRTYFFMILAIYLGISYLIKKKFLIKKYILPLLIFLLVFISLGIIYGKGGNNDNSWKENLSSSSETTAIYLVSSINALDIDTKDNVKAKYGGENTLLFFIKVIRGLGFFSNLKEGTLVSEFVFVPYPTNVFTFYSPYIRDFGKLYAWLMIGLIGVLHTWLFYKARETRNLRYTLYYSFLLFPLLMSFFQDQYMSLFSTWLQLIFYTETFLAINSLLIRKTRYQN